MAECIDGQKKKKKIVPYPIENPTEICFYSTAERERIAVSGVHDIIYFFE